METWKNTYSVKPPSQHHYFVYIIVVSDFSHYGNYWFLHACVVFNKSLQINFYIRAAFIFLLKLTSYSILHYLSSAGLSTKFSQLVMSIFIFTQYFFPMEFAQWKVWDYPTLLMSWFINFIYRFFPITSLKSSIFLVSFFYKAKIENKKTDTKNIFHYKKRWICKCVCLIKDPRKK